MTALGPRDRLDFLLVHGAWHGAAHWGRMAASLAASGHRSTAIDLPGCGPGAALPASYVAQNLAALSTEVSPVAHVTLEDQTAAVVSALASLQAHGPVVVAAHSAGGLPVTAALEQAPEPVDRVVYVAAHCPVAFPNMLGYLCLP